MAKIYIVDDDRYIVESMSLVLKTNGYEVAAQYDDENVVENITKYNPDLVILDVMFPENNSAGFEIAREIKKNPVLVNIPIIMLSVINEKGIYIGQFNRQDIDPTWLPVNLFLDKPIQPRELLKQIELILKYKL